MPTFQPAVEEAAPETTPNPAVSSFVATVDVSGPLSQFGDISTSICDWPSLQETQADLFWRLRQLALEMKISIESASNMAVGCTSVPCEPTRRNLLPNGGSCSNPQSQPQGEGLLQARGSTFTAARTPEQDAVGTPHILDNE